MDACYLNSVGLGQYKVVVRTRPRWDVTASKFASESVGEITPTGVNWGRVIDGTSTAIISVGLGGNISNNCCEMLSNIVPVAHEVVIYRNDVEVWLGPIISLDYSRDDAVLNCADLSWWLGHRRYLVDHDSTTLTGTGPVPLIDVFSDAIDQVVNVALQPVGAEDPLYFSNSVQLTPSTVLGERMYTTTQLVSDAVSDLSDSVVDWTMFRSVLFAREIELSPDVSAEVLRDEHTIDINNISLSGVDLATRVLVTGDPANIQGEVFAATTGDPIDAALWSVFGTVDRVFTDDSQDVPSATVSADTKFDVSKLQTAQVSDLSVRLNPTAPFEINDLVPGLKSRVSITHPCRTIDQILRLVSLDVSVGSSSESVSVTYEAVGAVE